VLIIIDTNIIQSDFQFSRPALRTLLQEQPHGYTVGLPLVVAWEHARHYLRERNKATGTLRGIDGPEAAPPKMQIEEARKIILDRASKAGFRLLPIPKTPQERMLDSCLRGSPPFDSEGRTGYQDALIWETVLEHAEHEEDVVLLSNDNDFGPKDGLHENLQSAAGALSHKVQRVSELKAFIDVHVMPKMQELKDISASIPRDQRVGNSGEFERELQMVLLGQPIHGSDLGLPKRYTRVYVTRVVGPLVFESANARRLDPNNVFVELSAGAVVNVMAEYWVQAGEDPDDVEQAADLFSGLKVRLRIDLIGNPSLDELRSVSVESVVAL
jgi:hypothetical protein